MFCGWFCSAVSEILGLDPGFFGSTDFVLRFESLVFVILDLVLRFGFRFYRFCSAVGILFCGLEFAIQFRLYQFGSAV